jgi:small subunit ribosomal protein S17
MRTKKGVVTSAKMDKTIVVSVHSYKSHAKYKKRYRVTTKFYAHDENNVCSEGDIVTIKETKPSSKLKRWALVEQVS